MVVTPVSVALLKVALEVKVAQERVPSAAVFRKYPSVGVAGRVYVVIPARVSGAANLTHYYHFYLQGLT